MEIACIPMYKDISFPIKKEACWENHAYKHAVNETYSFYTE